MIRIKELSRETLAKETGDDVESTGIFLIHYSVIFAYILGFSSQTLEVDCMLWNCHLSTPMTWIGEVT